ncbi:MAG: signal transduction histidine kinase [Gammaproteobacteria bacterium]|jgi:signal transduction histidine kinase
MIKTGKSGITRKLAWVIFIQLAFISIITVLGVIVAAKVVEGVMMRAALEGEAEYFWNSYTKNPDHPLPDTDNLKGFLAQEGINSDIPIPLLDMKSRFGRVIVEGEEVLVLVDSHIIKDKNTFLYLIFDEESVERLSFYFGVVPLSLILIIIYLSAWFGFRQSRKAISPVVKLADILGEFRPQNTPIVDLDLDNLKSGSSDDEINVLVDSLNSFTNEINELLDRERRFTRDASHELRTPLAVIKGSVEQLILMKNLDSTQKKPLERIQRTASDMNELVNALLLLARGNKSPAPAKEISINEVVDKLIEQLQLTHNLDKHVSIEVHQKSTVCVNAAEQFVEVVVGNILRNAYNYTRKGSVIIEISENYLQVSNKGEGVSFVSSEDMFKPFVRGKEHDNLDGLGVGLDIAKRLCEMYGWEIQGQYTVENGMTFHIHF